MTNREVSIYLRGPGKGDQAFYQTSHKMLSEDYQSLRKDYLCYAESGEPKGGAYGTIGQGDQKDQLILKFEEVAFIARE